MGNDSLTDSKTQNLIDKLAPLLADLTNIPESEIRDRLLQRAEYVALPSSQSALSKAEAKRQRKAAKFLKEQGEQLSGAEKS